MHACVFLWVQDLLGRADDIHAPPAVLLAVKVVDFERGRGAHREGHRSLECSAFDSVFPTGAPP